MPELDRPALDRTARYSTVAIWLHWIIAALVIAELAIGLLHESLLKSAFFVHKATGITVLALTIVRIVWRLMHRPPPLPAQTPVWEKGMAHATHWMLYGLLLALPLSGWVMVSRVSKRRPLDWFGVFDIPYLPVSEAAGGVARNAHGLLGWVALALVVLHVAAALRHHLLLRDTVLTRMAPVLDRG